MARKEPLAAKAAEFGYAADVISALDSEQRLQIILKLAEREHVVHELVSTLGKSQPLVSQHLRVLKRTGLVTSTRSGREVVYRLNVPETADIIELAEEIGRRAQEHDSVDELADRRGRSQQDSPQVSSITDESATGGKAAVAGRVSDTSLDMPGLVPDTPTPPTPRLQ